MSEKEEQITCSWFGYRRFGLLLALALSVFFWRVLFGGESFFYRDFGVLGYPTTFYFKDSITSGTFPLWNPYSNCGAPFLAQWGTMVLYPLHYILVLVPLPWGLNFFCILHLWIAGMGMHKLVRYLTASNWAAAVAAIVFVFNGITQAALAWPNYTVVIAWMPWLVYFARKAWMEGGKNLVLACLVGTMQMMSGAPEIILLTWAALAAIALADVLGKKQSAALVMQRMGFMVVLVAALSAVQLLPFLELVQNSQRQLGVSSTKWSMPYWGWANFILPMFHAFKTPQGTYFQEGQEFLASTYLGAGLLVCCVFALRERSGLRMALAALTVFGGLLALGPSGGIHPLIQAIAPGAGLIRYPVKAVYLVSFCAAILIGFFVADRERSSAQWSGAFKKGLIALAVVFIGLLWAAKTYPLPYDRWPDTLSNSTYRAGFAVAILALMIMGKELKMQREWAQFGLLLVIAVDAKLHLPSLNPTIPNSFMEAGLWKSAHGFDTGLNQGRIFITPKAEERLLNSTIADLKQDWVGKRMAGWSHLNLLEHAMKVNGSSTLQLKEQAQVQNMLYGTNAVMLDVWLHFLNVQRVSSPNSYAAWTNHAETSGSFVQGFGSAIYLPAEEILKSLGMLDVKKNLYLSEEAKSGATADKGNIEISNVNFGVHKILLQGKASNGGWVTIAQSWEKNWRALVNSQEVPVVRANHAFQSVRVPAGNFQVELKYVPGIFWIGTAISLCACVILGALSLKWRGAKSADGEGKIVNL